jgi:hypothetical protein
MARTAAAPAARLAQRVAAQLQRRTGEAGSNEGNGSNPPPVCSAAAWAASSTLGGDASAGANDVARKISAIPPAQVPRRKQRPRKNVPA